MISFALRKPLEPLDLVLRRNIPEHPAWALQPGTEGRRTWYSRLGRELVRIDDDQAAQTVSLVVLDTSSPMTVRHIPWRVCAAESYLVPETAPTLVDLFAGDCAALVRDLRNARQVVTDSL